MNIEDVRTYCLSLRGVSEDMPYGEGWVVYRIERKIFLHIALERGLIAIKLIPEHALELRNQYSGITPAWHMNKTHWSDVALDGTVPSRLIKELINESYSLVLNKLPKILQAKYR